MKKLLIYGLAALTALTFASCEKDNSGDEPQQPRKLVQSIASSYTDEDEDDGSPLVFEYDNQNRLIEMGYGRGIVESSTYKYYDDKIVETYTEPSGVYDIEYILENNRIVLRGDDVFLYSNENQLIAVGNEACTWSEGNIVKIEGQSDIRTLKYTQYPNHTNFNQTNHTYSYCLGFEGKLSKNWIEEEVDQSTSSPNSPVSRTTYTYVFDGSGNPTKIIRRESREGKHKRTTTMTITYK